MSDSNNIFVAVRIRPYARRELASASPSSSPSSAAAAAASASASPITAPPSVVCLEQKEETIHLLEPERDWYERDSFKFDKVFWSVPSEQTITPPGPCSSMFSVPDEPHTQKDVFDIIGAPAVECTIKGMHSTILAYGQTGAGKSHSMLGSDKDPGVAPRFVEQLFNAIEEQRDNTEALQEKYEVKVELGFLEIYNEKVKDLLAAATISPSSPTGESNYSSCRVRHHPEKGTFVEGLKRLEILTAPDCLTAINDGMTQRAVAPTSMNDTSSRSHGIFQLVVTQRFLSRGITRTSLVNLVDLAGSERVKQSQVTGHALVEATMINKSLSTLRRVIDVLIDNSTLKAGKKPAIPPYRESLLTWVLSDSLGGNSKTVMLAAISPAASSFEDTLSTLRYALKAKAIVCSAKVNEEKNAAVISSLKGEMQQLKQQLEENSSSSLRAEYANRQTELSQLEERGQKYQQRQEKVAEEIKNRETEIEEAQAKVSEISSLTEEKRTEEEQLKKLRQEHAQSAQELELNAASRQRAEVELQAAMQQRKHAEALHEQNEKELTEAATEQNKMKVRSLLTSFQAAFIRLLKGRDLAQLRKEKSKLISELEKVSTLNEGLNEGEKLLQEGKKKLDKELAFLQKKVDKVAHSDLLSSASGLRKDRRLVEVRKKQQHVDEQVEEAVTALTSARKELNFLQGKQQQRVTKYRVERSKLETEIAEIERQSNHLRQRIEFHKQFIFENNQAEEICRSEETQYLEELSSVQGTNNHRDDNIAALKEALTRERTVSELLQHEVDTKHRDFEFLSASLQEVKAALELARVQNENLKTRMDEVMLPPTPRFRRSNTNNSNSVSGMNNNNITSSRSRANSSTPALRQNFSRQNSQNSIGVTMKNTNNTINNNNNAPFSRSGTSMNFIRQQSSSSATGQQQQQFSRQQSSTCTSVASHHQHHHQDLHQQHQQYESNSNINKLYLKPFCVGATTSKTSFSRQSTPVSTSYFGRENTNVSTIAGEDNQQHVAVTLNGTVIEKGGGVRYDPPLTSRRRAVTPTKTTHRIGDAFFAGTSLAKQQQQHQHQHQQKNILLADGTLSSSSPFSVEGENYYSPEKENVQNNNNNVVENDENTADSVGAIFQRHHQQQNPHNHHHHQEVSAAAVSLRDDGDDLLVDEDSNNNNEDVEQTNSNVVSPFARLPSSSNVVRDIISRQQIQQQHNNDNTQNSLNNNNFSRNSTRVATTDNEISRLNTNETSTTSTNIVCSPVSSTTITQSSNNSNSNGAVAGGGGRNNNNNVLSSSAVSPSISSSSVSYQQQNNNKKTLVRASSSSLSKKNLLVGGINASVSPAPTRPRLGGRLRSAFR